jgi:hypothetical protein
MRYSAHPIPFIARQKATHPTASCRRAQASVACRSGAARLASLCQFWRLDHPLTMYCDAMEEGVQDEIGAAVAAHRELGPEYDSAVAESLIDRIGAEIDKRIDARLGPLQPGSPSPAESSWLSNVPPRLIGAGIGAAVAAGITGVVAMIANRGNTGPNSGAVDIAVIWVWGIVAIALVAAAFIGKHRSR